MADVIQLHGGYSPWKPSEDAELAKEYRRYNIPLEGVVSQHGVRYAFACVDGHDDVVSFWVYVHVSAEQESALDAGGEIEFRGPGALALVIEGVGIVASTLVEDFDDAEATRAAVRVLAGTLSDWAHEAEERGVELAS